MPRRLVRGGFASSVLRTKLLAFLCVCVGTGEDTTDKCTMSSILRLDRGSCGADHCLFPMEEEATRM